VKITCRDVAEKLLLFKDGELPAKETAYLKEHLHLCEECLAFLGSYDEVVMVLGRLKPVEMPPGVLDRVKRALREGKPPDC
jgi:hypothetical protein